MLFPLDNTPDLCMATRLNYQQGNIHCCTRKETSYQQGSSCPLGTLWQTSHHQGSSTLRDTKFRPDKMLR